MQILFGRLVAALQSQSLEETQGQTGDRKSDQNHDTLCLPVSDEKIQVKPSF